MFHPPLASLKSLAQTLVFFKPFFGSVAAVMSMVAVVATVVIAASAIVVIAVVAALVGDRISKNARCGSSCDRYAWIHGLSWIAIRVI